MATLLYLLSKFIHHIRTINPIKSTTITTINNIPHSSIRINHTVNLNPKELTYDEVFQAIRKQIVEYTTKH